MNYMLLAPTGKLHLGLKRDGVNTHDCQGTRIFYILPPQKGSTDYSIYCTR